MKINKVITPLEETAKKLFKDSIGTGMGEKYPYLSKRLEYDIFIKECDTKKNKSITRRKW